MDRQITYNANLMDVIHSLTRGSTLFVYVPNDKEGSHWTLDNVEAIRAIDTGEGIYELSTERGTVKVKAQ